MNRTIAAAAAASLMGAAAPALAATTIYTSPAAFEAATHGLSLQTFANNGEATLVAPSQTVGGVTFASDNLYYFNDAYGRPYISDDNFVAPDNFLISSNDSALGLFIASYFTSNSFSYTVNGVSGVIVLPAANDVAFLGFTNPGGPIDVSFAVPGNTEAVVELDVPKFVTGAAGAPEPAAWAMMILGVFGVGALARRRAAIASAV